ncbi:MAG TPA: CBS domain-containing protein [Gaiellales bacterium]
MRPAEVIFSHGSTDFDALGSMLAVRRLYPNAAILLHGGLNRNVREFVALHAEELGLADAAECDLDGVTRAIVVETSDDRRLGDLAGLLHRDGIEVFLFDHHGDDLPAWAPAHHAVRSHDGALSSTLAGILAERGIEPTATEATALALGIHEDTGSLTYPTTTVRDVEALAFCMRHGGNQDLVGGFLHTPLGDDHRALLTTLIDAAEQRQSGGVGVLVAAARWPRYVDGVSTLAGKITDLTDAQALVMLVEMDGRVFAVGRSRTPAFDVAAVMAGLGGGGHAQAASAIVRDQPLERVVARLPELLAAGVASGPRAADIMSSPPWFVDAGATIDEALAECRRRHTSGVPIASGGDMVGVVEREDLGRAIGHRLGHAPVRGIMSAEVIAVGPDATLADVQRALVHGAGRLAVTADGESGPHPTGEVLGIVTRGDLLRAMRDAPPGAPPAPAVDLGPRLRALPGLERLWPSIAEAAADVAGLYLVGGAVRDLLLDEPTFDIDLAVEGDGVAFADRLAASLGGRAHAHDKFHTAVVIAGDLRVDVASARTEHYEYPAALPTVEHSSIRQDLYRRDFTINAMAVSLLPAEFGLLVDPYGGGRDLRSGVVRVLHNLSFIEDPTRIFRAVRYENRYAFEMDALTRQLAQSCVDMGLVGDLSGARVRDELVAILSEHEVSRALHRISQIALGRALHPALDCGEEADRLVERFDAARRRHAPEQPAWRGRLAVLARGMPGDELDAWLERLRVRRRDARVVAAAAVVPPRLQGPLERTEEPARIAELLAAQPVEVALVMLAGGGAAGERAELYLERLRQVTLDIDGDTLREQFGMAESPQIGRVLAELLRRRRNGELGGRDQQLDAARELLAEVAR